MLYLDKWKRHVRFDTTPNKKRRVSGAGGNDDGDNGNDMKVGGNDDGDNGNDMKVDGCQLNYDENNDMSSTITVDVELSVEDHPGEIDNTCLLPMALPSEMNPNHSYPFVLIYLKN